MVPPARLLGEINVRTGAGSLTGIGRAGVTIGVWAALMSGAALAQSASDLQEVQAPRAVAFDIAAQSLASALMTLGRQAGLQVAVDPPAVAGRSSAGVRGTMSVELALQTLLAGTGLTFQISGTSVQIRAAGAVPGAVTLDPVQVQGAFPVPQQAMIDNIPPPYAGGQVATGGQLGLLGNRGVMDTPFNQTSYTAQKVQNQQATTVFDALADDPSVRLRSADGNVNGASATMRGFFTSPADTLYGGLYGVLPYYSVNAEVAERIEVLKGPSAMLDGMVLGGGIGGSINIVPKRAPEEPLAQFTASYASNSLFRGHADLGQRFGPEKQFGVRFNGVFQGGETGTQWNTDNRALALLGLDFRGENVRLSSDLGYQYQYVGGAIPELGLANNVPLPWAPDARKSQGGPWGYVQRVDAFGTVRGEVDITDNVTAYAAFGARDNRDQYLTPRSVTITNFNGAATTQPRGLSFYFQNLTGSAGVRAVGETGPIKHQIALNAMVARQEFGVGFASGTTYATNIYNPTYTNQPNIATPSANKSSVTTLSSLALADTLSAADNRVQLTVGARLQQVQVANFDTTTGAMTSYTDTNALSPSVGLVVKPWWQNVSFYGNFIQGLQPGTIVPNNFTNAGQAFPPYVSTQLEAGVKVDWGILTTTLSLFQITQPSTLTNVETNSLVLNGQQRNQGLEFNFFGELVPGIRVLGGAMLLSAVLTKTQNGATNGWIAPMSPGAQFNIGGEWDTPFVRGLTLNGRFTYTGSQFIDTALPRRSLPEWTRVDIGARYVMENLTPTGKPVGIRFNVENLFDNDYWAGGAGPTTLFLGAPRTFRLALTSDF